MIKKLIPLTIIIIKNCHAHKNFKNTNQKLTDVLNNTLQTIYDIPYQEIVSEKLCFSKDKITKREPYDYCYCSMPKIWIDLFQDVVEASENKHQIPKNLHVTPDMIYAKDEDGISNFDCTEELKMCSIFYGYDLLTDFDVLKELVFDKKIRTKFDFWRCMARAFYFLKPMFWEFSKVWDDYNRKVQEVEYPEMVKFER